MYKVLRSYSKKAERKHEMTRSGTDHRTGTGGGMLSSRNLYTVDMNDDVRNGQVVPADRDGLVEAAWASGQAFSESSSYEAREHFERKVQRVKKTRGERDSNRKSKRSKVSDVLSSTDGVSARDALLQWAQDVTRGYPGVNVRNFTSSWRDGLAFNAILHRYRPNLIQWSKISNQSVSARERLNNAFAAAESEFAVSRLLDAEDVDVETPDEKSIITYVSSLYNALPHTSETSKYEELMYEYEREAAEWLHWVERATRIMEDRQLPTTIGELRRVESELDRFKAEELPPKARDKERLAAHYNELYNLFDRTELLRVSKEFSTQGLERAWQRLLRSLNERQSLVEERAGLQGSATDLISRLTRGIGITNEKLDHILNRIEDTEARIETSRPTELQRVIDGIIDDLTALEAPIISFFEDVDQLKQSRHPEANDFYQQVFGLEQRRQAYLSRLRTQFLARLGVRSEQIMRESEQKRETVRRALFERVEDCIRWIRTHLEKLTEMEFVEDLEQLERMFEEHKIDNHEIQDFRKNVDECIARQAEIAADDTAEYCELLSTLESEYQQLRDLSAGRMLDLDTLIAFVRGAQQEIVWISEREEIEVTRNWTDISQLDLPMLQNYYKQLLHEIELREPRFNDVHNKGAALLNQGHPAIHVIEYYLNGMQRKWDWLLCLSKCLEHHLRDALNLKSFMEDANAAEEWMLKQTELLERKYNRMDTTLREGEQMLRELDEISELIKKYHTILLTLTERSSQISPLWQRGERIQFPMSVSALVDYDDRNISIRENDDCLLMDNSDLIHWLVRGTDSAEALVPSVIFRIPPPDARLTSYLNRLHASFEKLRRLWEKKHSVVRYNIVLNTMAQIRNWDLNTFAGIIPEERDAILKALNDDAQKLLSEMGPNDPLSLRLREELKLTNDHYYSLLNEMNRPKEPEVSAQFDIKIVDLLKKLNEAYRILNDRVSQGVPRSPDGLEKLIIEHKDFEDDLQALDIDVSTAKELFRQIPNPTPSQRATIDHLSARWEDLWELSRMYVERLKSLEAVLNGIAEVADIVHQHEVTLNSFDDMPAALDRLRGVHSQLLELNMVLQQQQSVVDAFNKNIALLRQHVSRTRQSTNHPDVDRLEDDVQLLTVRWENVCSQVAERLKNVERALQTQMVYRTEFENEINWLDNVERTINSLRRPEDLRPEQYQQQLDQLIAEYAQLQERTEATESVNREGGKFIREAKGYDSRLMQYLENVLNIRGPTIAGEFRRSQPQPKNGAQQVAEELEFLNKRFAQLSSLILERRNVMQVLIQKWKRQKQEALHNECVERQTKMVEILDDFGKMSALITERFWMVTSAEDAASVHDRMQVMRSELLSRTVEVKENIDEADRLCTEGAEYLTPEQFHSLKEQRNRLEKTYNELLQHTDVVLTRLSDLAKFLLDFSSESSILHSFINEKTREVVIIKAESGDPLTLQRSRQKAKLLLDEVTNAEMSVKNISEFATRIQSEIDGYVVEMRLQYPSVKFPSIDAHELTATVSRLVTDYEALFRSCNDLSAFLSRLTALALTHQQTFETATNSIAELERKISDAETSVRSIDAVADSAQMSTLLSELEALQQASFEQTDCVDAVASSATELDNALVGTDAHDRIIHENQREIDELTRRKQRAQERISENLDTCRSRLAKSEGIRDGLANIERWLAEEEERLSQPTTLPLAVDKLIELRHQHELAQRELSSRQKVISELHDGARKIAAANPQSKASKQLLESCGSAQKKLSSLITTSKACGDNIFELTRALGSFNDDERSTNEKLNALDEKLSYASPSDTKLLDGASEQLKEIIEDDFERLYRKYKWILSVPDVDEEEDLKKNMEKLKGAIEKLSSKIGEFSSYATALEEQRKAYEHLKVELISWLEQIETQARTRRKMTLNPVELAKQGNAFQQLQKEYQNYRPNFEKLNEIGSKLMEVESFARLKSRSSSVPSEQVKAAVREISIIEQRYEALGAFIKAKNEEIVTDSANLAEWDILRDTLQRWVISEDKRLMSDCPIALEHGIIDSNLSKAESMEKECQKKRLEMEDLRNKLRLLLSERAVFGSTEIENAQNTLEKAWTTLHEDISLVKEKNLAARELIEDSENLNRWLRQKERMLSAIGAVNVDPKVIDNQIIQIELLENEVMDYNALHEKVNETAHELITGSIGGNNSRQIAGQMDVLNLRWLKYNESLAEKKAKLQKIKEAGQSFTIKQREVKQVLLAVSEGVEEAGRSPLSCSEDVEKQLEKLKSLSEQTNEVEKHLGSLKQLAAIVDEMVAGEPALQSDIREQLKTTLQAWQELNRKIESLRNAAVSTKDQESQTAKESKTMLKWIRQAEGQLAEIGSLTADRVTLNDQCNRIDEVYHTVLDKEGDLSLLRAKLIEQLKKSPNIELKTALESLAASWNPLLEEVKMKKANGERARDLVEQFEGSLKAFNSQIDEQRALLTESSKAKKRDMSQLISIEERVERQQNELNALGLLVQKLGEVTAGPSLRRVGKDVENATDDWKILTKDVKNLSAKAVQMKEAETCFLSCKERAVNLLNEAVEKASEIREGSSELAVSREVILKTVAGLERAWQKQERDLNASLKNVQNTLEREEAEQLANEIRAIKSDFMHSLSDLREVCDVLMKKDELFENVKLRVTALKSELRLLLSKEFSPIHREACELKAQNEECDMQLAKLEEKEKEAGKLSSEWLEAVNSGPISMARKNSVIQQLDEVKEDLSKQRTLITQRKRTIDNVLMAVKELEKQGKTLCDEFGELLNDEVLLEPIKTELSELRVQQEKLRLFRDKLRPTSQICTSLVDNCDKLIKGAGSNVSTETVETLKKDITESWAEINNRVAGREKQICAAMQELGSYSDAYSALLAWLQDTEESLANQRPPSIEHKVVKEQTRANEILLKHIEEKQQSVDGFKAMIDKIITLTMDETHRATIREQAENIAKRYRTLLHDAHARRGRLHEALILSEEWAQVVGPLKMWLDATELSLQQLGKVPTDEEKLRQLIELHQELTESIKKEVPNIEKMASLCPVLANLTSDEEATELETTFKKYMVKYENLCSRSDECGVLLEQVGVEIATFLDRTDTLTEWLDKIEGDVDKVDNISIYPEELIEQSTLLAELAMAVTEQEALVSTLVEVGRELCRQTTGDEAIALQSRIEALRTRYTKLASLTDSKIELLSEALPLSERFHNGFEAVQEWMDAVEKNMQTLDQAPLEAQSSLITQMEEDLGKLRLDVDGLNATSKQLQRLSSGPRADELEAHTDDLVRRFGQIAEQITRKADKLTSAEKQSRQVLDELDYLNEWFADARDRLMQASAPAVDPDYVKKQLKNQKQMNEDIAVMRARLRDAAADAQRVTRALGDEASGQDSLLANKIETGRVLSADVTQIGEDRLGELEQAFALCQEVDTSYSELDSWLVSVEEEIESCPPVITNHQREQLMQQQVHNSELQQSIISYKALLDRFYKNVQALSELCDSEDEKQLEKIAEGLEERFGAARDAIQERAEALETAIEQNSQFSDRLDIILANLDGTATQVRNAEPVSADPDRIRSQIMDNGALMEHLKHKESVLHSVKENAKEILARAKPNDAAAAEIRDKINELDMLWGQLVDDVTIRGNLLGETLIKAQCFWAELQKCQKAVEELRMRIEGIQPANGQPAVIEEQKNALMVIEEEMRETGPVLMDKLRSAGVQLCNVVAEEEKAHVEQQINAVEGNWTTVTDICAKKNTDLVEAMEKAMDFHGLLTELSRWIAEAEERAAKYEPLHGASSTDIRNELASLSELRSLLDEKALEKEQLNQLCANLCGGTTAQQSAIIRAPVNDLNVRWSRLYALLNERQQKMEKALLEMGHFSQAYEQLISWIEKTEHILNEINPRPTNIKQAEVEVCKHRVIQNDVLVHEASVDTLNTAAKRIIAADPQAASATQPVIDHLNARWHTLVDKLEDIWEQLSDARKVAENLGGEMDRWSLWLQDKDADLSHSKPTGGLPETALAQLDDFFVLKAEIEQSRPELEAHLVAANKYISDNLGNKDTWIAQREAQLQKKWIQVQEKLGDREQKLKIALTEAEQLYKAMQAMNEWLGSAEVRLGRMEHPSRIPDTLEKQMLEQSEFQNEVHMQRELMGELNSRGTKLQYYCEKKDAIPIKNLLVSAKHRFDKILSRSTDRTKQLDLAFQEARLYFETHSQLLDWIEGSLAWLNEHAIQMASGIRLREDLKKHKEFQRDLADRQPMYDATYKRGKSLSEHAPRIEQADIEQMNENLKEKWTEICNAALQRQRSIEDALLACGQFDEALSLLREWLEKELPNLEKIENEPVHGDLETVTKLADEIKDLKAQIETHRGSLKSVKQRAQEMLSGKEADDETLDILREKLNKIDDGWAKLEGLARERDERIKIALDDAKTFDTSVHAFLDLLPRIEARLRTKSQSADVELEILEQMDEVAQLRKEMDDQEARMLSIRDAGRSIQEKCHPLAEQPMKYWLKILQTRWDEISNGIESKREELEKQLDELRAQENLINDLLRFIAEKSMELKNLSESPFPEDVDSVNKLIEEHEHFEKSLRHKQSSVDEAVKGRKKAAITDQVKKKGGKALPMHELPVRSSKSDQLSDRWKKLWIDSMDYGRKLREMMEYLKEVERLKSFTFEEWRERYLEWTDSGKARISDLFRRIDKSGTGRVPRAAFIDGIISSKFPTTRLEMEKVADEFDKGDGMIDAKEFMAKLRTDFSKKMPLKQKTDNEKITEEVTRQTERCSCRSPYKIQKVGEGHYRFGETQIKRMVRILRSTVMVRVGGGWVALDEFLHKHDPCRAKGRTNLDIQRGFYDDVRPKNAFDTMETFTKSARSTPVQAMALRGFQEHTTASRYQATPGPITKVREKTERSMPMHVTRRTPNASRSSPSDTPKSSRRTSDVTPHDSKIARPTRTGSVSHSGSQGDILDISRPASRSSDVSESDRPTRIPSLRGRKSSYKSSVTRASPQLH